MENPSEKKAAHAQISQRRAKTLNTIVRDAILEMIIAGELTPGDRINESALAGQFEVSRGPIREACRSLEQAGLLTSVVNQGVFVRRMTLDEARSLYEVRGALAGLAGRLLVQRATREQIEQLSGLVDEMQVAAASGDLVNYYTLNLAFHGRIVDFADNETLKTSYHWIINQLHLFRQRGLVQAGSLLASNAEHRDIVVALQSRDEDASERALRRHVANGWARFSAVAPA